MTRLPAAKRREQLLACAAKLFAERGYARATTAELAKRAGVTEPIIYRHFNNKLDLFIALIERAGRETIAQWTAHLQGSDDPAERLRLLLGENPMVSPEGRDAYRVLLQAITEVHREPDVQKAIDKHMQSLHRFLTAEVQRAQEEHKLTRRFSADLIAWLLIDIGLGYGVLSALGVRGHGSSPDGGHVQELISRVLTGPRASGGERHAV
ncbi:MAG: TetR/AcrR family transcriptional regulator [Phycisphaeraceae bacterium]|nr:TetR/AcrR family transcriptional regulator [Phycisphaeraceae bacterium]MCW5754775.1 TetR/AcrR family transcriptional regulator [Phycisphaeraceae bacterium]